MLLTKALVVFSQRLKCWPAIAIKSAPTSSCTIETFSSATYRIVPSSTLEIVQYSSIRIIQYYLQHMVEALVLAS